MSGFIVYDATGKILRTGSCPDDIVSMQAWTGETAMVGQANDATQYISAGLVTNKPALGSAIDKTTIIGNGVDAATITNLPNPTTATITGSGVNQQATTATGSLALTFNTPGAYLVHLEALNRLAQEYTINAT